jgi:hypothetical protein
MLLEKLLSGTDLRSLGRGNSVVRKIQTQADFDELFSLLFHTNRIIVMRAADSVEKISITKRGYLQPHKKEILTLCRTASDKELVWHLAQLVPRLILTNRERKVAWNQLSAWALDKHASRIVRVNALQGLAELSTPDGSFESDFDLVIQMMEKENIPSINARIRILRKKTKPSQVRKSA